MRCPTCGSRLHILLGRLGRLLWYRCRDCGIDWNRTVPKPSRARNADIG